MGDNAGGKNEAIALLLAASLVYGKDEDEPDGDQILDMGDTWAWGTAWGEHVKDEDLPEVARLVRKYGYCGALYWMSEQHDQMRSEFHDINRFVQFVRAEELIVKKYPHSSERAYKKTMYTIGEEPA